MIGRLSEWIEHLSAKQKTQIATTLEGAAAYKITASAVASFLPVVGPLGAAVAGLGAAGIVSQEGIGGLVKALKPLMDAVQDVGRIMAGVLIPVAQALAEILKVIGPAIKAIADNVAKLGKSANDSGVGSVGGSALRVGGAALVGGKVAGAPGAIIASAAMLAWEIGSALGRADSRRAGYGPKTKVQEEGRERLMARSSAGPEAIEQTFARLSQAGKKAVFRGAKTTEEEHLDVAKKQLEQQEKTNEMLAHNPPLVRGDPRV
jgi:hypothetical protein